MTLGSAIAGGLVDVYGPRSGLLLAIAAIGLSSILNFAVILMGSDSSTCEANVDNNRERKDSHV